MKQYEVRLAITGRACLTWYTFGSAKEAVKFVKKELLDTGFTMHGRTFEEKFEEIMWVGKGRIVS